MYVEKHDYPHPKSEDIIHVLQSLCCNTTLHSKFVKFEPLLGSKRCYSTLISFVRCDAMRYGTIRYDMIRYDTIPKMKKIGEVMVRHIFSGINGASLYSCCSNGSSCQGDSSDTHIDGCFWIFGSSQRGQRSEGPYGRSKFQIEIF